MADKIQVKWVLLQFFFVLSAKSLLACSKTNRRLLPGFFFFLSKIYSRNNANSLSRPYECKLMQVHEVTGSFMLSSVTDVYRKANNHSDISRHPYIVQPPISLHSSPQHSVAFHHQSHRKMSRFHISISKSSFHLKAWVTVEIRNT